MSHFSFTIIRPHLSNAAVDFGGSVAKWFRVDTAARGPGFDVQLSYLLAWPRWTSHLISLCSRSLTYKNESEIVSISIRLLRELTQVTYIEITKNSVWHREHHVNVCYDY